MLGLGIYVGTQIVGRLLRYLLLSPMLVDWSTANGITNEVFDEPMELVGAMSFLMSMLALWRDRRSYPKEQDHAEYQ